jgi:hypothetical protein
MRSFFMVLAGVAFATIIVGYWLMLPGKSETRFRNIRVGMPRLEVQEIMGSNGDSTEKRYRIADKEQQTQKVWLAREKLKDIEIVVVFDDDSRVIAKDIYKSWTVLNWLGE